MSGTASTSRFTLSGLVLWSRLRGMLLGWRETRRMRRHQRTSTNGAVATAARPRARATAQPTAVDLRMMRRAIELAGEAAAVGEVPVGAVVYRGEEIIAEAYNLREQTNDPTAHAELLAIRDAGPVIGEWRLSGCSLAVTLEPCPMCAGAMVNSRIDRVVYGATDPKAGACDTMFHIPTDHRLNHRVEVIGGVMADECAELLRAFFRARRDARKHRMSERQEPTAGSQA